MNLEVNNQSFLSLNKYIFMLVYCNIFGVIVCGILINDDTKYLINQVPKYNSIF